MPICLEREVPTGLRSRKVIFTPHGFARHRLSVDLYRGLHMCTENCRHLLANQRTLIISVHLKGTPAVDAVFLCIRIRSVKVSFYLSSSSNSIELEKVSVENVKAVNGKPLVSHEPGYFSCNMIHLSSVIETRNICSVFIV